MRILIISNFYPPYHTSGYELGCQVMVESLKAREHQVKVLTSTYGATAAHLEDDIHRSLGMNSKESSNWPAVFLKERINQTVFKRICRDFEPEVVFIFNLSNISLSLVLLAQEMDFPTCYYFANNWFITMEKDPWYQLWPKEKKGFRILRFLTQRFTLLPPSQAINTNHSIYSNSYLKNIALQLDKTSRNAVVIPWGIDTDRFPFQEVKNQKPSRLLCVGQIKPHKGFDHAIKTLKLLNREGGHQSYTLTIAGSGESSSDYVAYLYNLAQTLGVQNSLSFPSVTMREDMPDLYHAHDILLSPSVCETSLNLSLLEAMSCGIPIVSTSTAGNSDILKNEFNALIFENENPRSCFEQIQRLSENPDLQESIRKNGRDAVKKHLPIDQTVHSIEQVLEDSIRSRKKEYVPQTFEQLPASAGTMRDESLTNLISQTKRWLKFGNLVVFMHHLLNPQFFVYVVKKIFEKTAPFLPLLFFPIFLGSYFKLTGRHRKISEIKPDKIRNVLVIQLTDIGDVILTSPFLRELRRFLPHARIVLIVQPRMFNLVEKCPHVDEVLPYDWRAAKKWKTSFYGCLHWWLQSARIAKRSLWKHRLDLAISTRWNNDPCQASSIILMYMSGAPFRIGYRNAPQSPKLFGVRKVNRLITAGPVRTFPKHEVERQLDILRYMGANPIDTRLEVWTTQKEELFARDILQKFDQTKADLHIAFAPGASWPFRRWPSNRFIQLGSWLQEKYKANILIIAAKVEQELSLSIEKGLHSSQTLNLTGETTLREMASILKQCKLFIGNDSGPLHVAAASGVPVIGLFGPGEYQRFKPWGTGHEAIYLGLSCSPCSENCLFNEPRCIKGITLSEVKKAVSEKLTSLLARP
jgi:ADP-heptose:LPS heptosyltransferase/glycosyltransferase involved in cell wall biosynthesis